MASRLVDLPMIGGIDHHLGIEYETTKYVVSVINNRTAGRCVIQIRTCSLPPSATCCLGTTKLGANQEIHPTFQINHGRLFYLFFGIIIFLDIYNPNLLSIIQIKPLPLKINSL